MDDDPRSPRDPAKHEALTEPALGGERERPRESDGLTLPRSKRRAVTINFATPAPLSVPAARPPERLEGLSLGEIEDPITQPIQLPPREDHVEEAVKLVSRSRPRSVSSFRIDLENEMQERMALDDFTSALRAAQLLLGASPAHAEALRIQAECTRRLIALLSSRLGGFAARPRLRVEERELRWLGLDKRAEHLVDLIDGERTVAEIAEGAEISALDALRGLVDLAELHVIALR